MQKLNPNPVPEAPHAMAALVPNTLAHLTDKDLDYFRRWFLMLQLENGENNSSRALSSLWCKDPGVREENGSCLIDLKILKIDELSKGEFVHSFKRSSNLPNNFVVGESVIVSSRTEIAISIGPVRSTDENEICAVFDKSLPRNAVYFLDRYEYQNGLNSFFTNISLLLADNIRSKTLRQLIIEKSKPEFEPGVDKKSVETVEKIKRLLGHLNKEQQRAALRPLMAKHYSILKGFPGTGKTRTVAGLIRLLVASNYTVLVTSYTNTSVDNILLMLRDTAPEVDFIRLGRSSRIHHGVLSRSEETLTKNFKTLPEFERLYSSVSVVGATCLGMGHALFRRKTFDFCVVDEAAQALEVSCLGPLFFCAKFILVGDSLQLPPVVKSEAARKLGMTKSLIEQLDCHEDAVVTLTTQYRMNRSIMRIANDLTYDGKLKCANDEVSESTIEVDLLEHSVWVQ